MRWSRERLEKEENSGLTSEYLSTFKKSVGKIKGSSIEEYVLYLNVKNVSLLDSHVKKTKRMIWEHGDSQLDKSSFSTVMVP